MKFNKNDKVARKGTFDGNVGTVKDPNYLGCMVLVRFPGGEAAVDASDLIKYEG